MAAEGGPVFDGERRKEMAGAFLDGGERYEKVRPGYPAASLQWLIAGRESEIHSVLDVGAGTGKYTQLLTGYDFCVTAVDPSYNMLQQLRRTLPSVKVIVGTAEETSLPDNSAQLVVVAQAWHWCDYLAASTELARVLTPGGTLGLVWNQLDVSIPWVHRLARIMHAGDVHKADFSPPLGREFSSLQAQLTPWEQQITPEGIIELAKSRSYYLKANELTRAKVVANLQWYLFQHLGHTPGAVRSLPYLCQSWRARTDPHG